MIEPRAAAIKLVEDTNSNIACYCIVGHYIPPLATPLHVHGGPYGSTGIPRINGDVSRTRRGLNEGFTYHSSRHKAQREERESSPGVTLLVYTRSAGKIILTSQLAIVISLPPSSGLGVDLGRVTLLVDYSSNIG